VALERSKGEGGRGGKRKSQNRGGDRHISLYLSRILLSRSCEGGAREKREEREEAIERQISFFPTLPSLASLAFPEEGEESEKGGKEGKERASRITRSRRQFRLHTRSLVIGGKEGLEGEEGGERGGRAAAWRRGRAETVTLVDESGDALLGEVLRRGELEEKKGKGRREGEASLRSQRRLPAVRPTRSEHPDDDCS